MRLITKETDYAIRAVMSLARSPGRFVSSGEISTRDGIPLQFLRRILQRLLKARLLTSREGVGGGVRLRVSPEKIRVSDIMSVFQGRVALAECMFRKRLCANRGTCVLRARITEIERNLAAQFAGVSIADLLREADSGSRRRPRISRHARRPRSVPPREGRQPKRGTM
jgi:Rrf2 family protein